MILRGNKNMSAAQNIWKLRYLRPSVVFASRCTRSGSLRDPIIDLWKTDWYKGIKNSRYHECLREYFHRRSSLAGPNLILISKSWSFQKHFWVFPKINLKIQKKFYCFIKQMPLQLWVFYFFIPSLLSTWRLVSVVIGAWHLVCLLVWSEGCISVLSGIQRMLIHGIIVFASMLVIAIPLYWTFYAHLLNRHS